MFRNFLRMSVRNLQKNKIFTGINVSGLAIGIASCMLILLFVKHELSYDRFHEKANQIYRVGMKIHVGTNQFDIALGPCPLSDGLIKDFPEVQTVTRIFTRQSRNKNTYVRYLDKQFKEIFFIWADPSIFDVFTIPFIQGDPQSALKELNSVIITSSTAEKYFGEDDPLGKMVTLEDGSLYKVTGVVESLPPHSHFRYDFIASFQSVKKSFDPDWYDTAVYTYIVLPDNYPFEELNSKFPQFSRKYYEPIVQKSMGISYDQFLESGNLFSFFLEPLTDIHLYSNIQNEFGSTGNINTVFIFSAIALVILLVACINFINLSTSRLSSRANEVGVRKAAGSSRRQLIFQFLTESICLSTFSVVVGVSIVYSVLPLFNRLIGKNLSLSIFPFSTIVPVLILAAVLIGFLAGLYPAFLLSSLKPVTVLKGKYKSSKSGRKFRNGLVVFQFVTSIILFVGTIVIYQQLKFLRNKNLGIDKDRLVVVLNAEKLANKQLTFKTKLKQNGAVVDATFTDSLPQMLLEVKMFQKEGSIDNHNHTLLTISSDYDFLKTYKPKLLDGRFFNKKNATDDYAILVNQATLRELNIENPFETRLLRMGHQDKPYRIIGILDDIHLQSLHFKIQPMAVILLQRPGVLLSVRLQANNIKEGLNHINVTWNSLVPSQALEHVFFDDQFKKDYMSEIRSGKVISIFAALAICVACLGLFGMATFFIEQRTKEIGIRKVLGASVSVIFYNICIESVRWVLLANLIAWPTAYYVMHKWLQNFAYRIHVQLWMLMLSAFFAFLIALITISYQTLKAAYANPVQALKYE